MTRPATAANDPTPSSLLDLALGRPPTLGAGRLVSFDGPAGSGKTTWAARTVEAFTARGGAPASVVHMDDLVGGWSGLPQVDAQLADLLEPLADGRAGSYRRYDWLEERFAERIVVEPVPLLVLEGVGCGASRFAALRTLLVWIEAPHEVRMQRGLARDGDAFAPHWEGWARDEAVLFAREGTRERAEVLIDATLPYPPTGPPAGSGKP